MRIDKPETQTQEVLYELLINKEIDRMSMMQTCGILNLPARISYLRSEDIGINTRPVRKKNKFGRVVVFGRYSLTDKNKARRFYLKMKQKHKYKVSNSQVDLLFQHVDPNELIEKCMDRNPFHQHVENPISDRDVDIDFSVDVDIEQEGCSEAYKLHGLETNIIVYKGGAQIDFVCDEKYVDKKEEEICTKIREHLKTMEENESLNF